MRTARMPLARIAGRRPLRPRARASPAHRAIAVVVAAGVCLGVSGVNWKGVPPADPTGRYLATLDLRKFERNGTRYTDPDLSAYRILPSLTTHDVTYHYDFARLATTEDRLRGVDRTVVLREIFRRATAGVTTPHDQRPCCGSCTGLRFTTSSSQCIRTDKPSTTHSSCSNWERCAAGT